MRLPYSNKLIPRAKELRKNATPQERHLWYDFLRTFPVRFQRQKSIDNFIADFYCHDARLIIELDGSQHYTADGMAYDEARTAVLEAYDLSVLRFTNPQIDREFEAVCKTIQTEVTSRTTHPT